MEYFERLRSLSGSALDNLARALYERDVKTFKDVIIGLVRLGTMRDYETAATMLATAPIRAHSGKTNYADAALGALVFDQYFNMFLNICEDCGMVESEFMPILLCAQYADRSGAFFAWDKSVDRYITALAKVDFDRAAEYIEKYDKKFGKYGVLIAVDRDRALNRLLYMALYVKNIDKAAARDVLMDYPDVADVLIALYGKSKAQDRVVIVRLLLMYKNDERVREFLSKTVAADKSKSVREAVFNGKKVRSQKNAAKHLEELMTTGTGLAYTEWQDLLSNREYADVADKIFFYMILADGRVSVLVYNDGKFLDSTDKAIAPQPDKKIFVMHPLDVTEESSNILALKITQPFLQINRPTFDKVSGEQYYSMRLAGTMIARDEFYKNMKQTGFAFCDKRADDEKDVAVCVCGDHAVAVDCDLPSSSYTVSCGKLAFYRASDIVKLKRKRYISTANPLDIRSLSLRTYSELVYCAYRLFGEQL